MKLFSAPGYLLVNSRTEVKVIYTGFLTFALIGLTTMAIFELGRIGFSPVAVATYFRGGELGEQMRFAKTFGELLELTHFHAFIMGTVYLILGHLFVASLTPAWVRWSAIWGTLGATFGDLAAVWLVRYAGAGFAYLTLVCWIAEWVGYGMLIGVPLVQMWQSPPAEDED
jgi:hypothetical protein